MDGSQRRPESPYLQPLYPHPSHERTPFYHPVPPHLSQTAVRNKNKPHTGYPEGTPLSGLTRPRPDYEPEGIAPTEPPPQDQQTDRYRHPTQIRRPSGASESSYEPPSRPEPWRNKPENKFRRPNVDDVVPVLLSPYRNPLDAPRPPIKPPADDDQPRPTTYATPPEYPKRKPVEEDIHQHRPQPITYTYISVPEAPKRVRPSEEDVKYSYETPPEAPKRIKAPRPAPDDNDEPVQHHQEKYVAPIAPVKSHHPQTERPAKYHRPEGGGFKSSRPVVDEEPYEPERPQNRPESPKKGGGVKFRPSEAEEPSQEAPIRPQTERPKYSTINRPESSRKNKVQAGDLPSVLLQTFQYVKPQPEEKVTIKPPKAPVYQQKPKPPPPQASGIPKGNKKTQGDHFGTRTHPLRRPGEPGASGEVFLAAQLEEDEIELDELLQSTPEGTRLVFRVPEDDADFSSDVEDYALIEDEPEEPLIPTGDIKKPEAAVTIANNDASAIGFRAKPAGSNRTTLADLKVIVLGTSSELIPH